MEELRDKFFNECTIKEDGLSKINLTPHNVFEWFSSKQTVVKSDIKELIDKLEQKNFECGLYPLSGCLKEDAKSIREQLHIAIVNYKIEKVRFNEA